MEQHNHDEDGRADPRTGILERTARTACPSPICASWPASWKSPSTRSSTENLERLANMLGLEQPEIPSAWPARWKAGISHEVLNARKHTEESQIIAGAGAFGAVTIATNMAGRGVDIKLGGELAEEVISAVSRVLRPRRARRPLRI